MQNKFKTHYNAHEFPKLYSINTLPSETVPGMGYTIPEIMQKFASGVNPNVNRPLYYDGIMGEENNLQPDITLDPTFDFGEAHLRALELEESIQERRAAQKVEIQEVTTEEPTLEE